MNNKKSLAVMIGAMLLVPPFVSETLASETTAQFNAIELLTADQMPVSEWLRNNEAFIIQLTPAGEHSEPSLTFQVFAGDTDLSALFDYQDQQLVFSGAIPLPPGEMELAVYQYYQDDWQFVGSAPLKVMSVNGVKKAEWDTSLSVTVASQLDEQVSGDATPSERARFSDVTAALGITSEHEVHDTRITSQFNLLSVSNRQQAIQFGNRLNDASKLDISDYLVAVENGGHQVQLGHTSYGNNSLVVDGLSRRGVSWAYRNEDNMELNGAVLSGSDFVGYNNFFGLADYSQQHIKALGFGMNLSGESALQLRLEATYMDGKRQAVNDFGIGEIASAETNKALGLKLLATDTDGKLNADLSVAASRYENPDDANLNFGEDLVELDTDTAIAHQFNLSYQLIDNAESALGYTRLTLNASHASAEPLYQTLTAFVQANVRSSVIGAQYQVGAISGQISSSSSRDNLDNLVTLLTTRTRTDSLSMSTSLAELFDKDVYQEGATSLWPGLDYSYQNNHQYAINSPDENQSGFNDTSHLPDQVTDNHSLSLAWQVADYSLSVQSSYSLQDNRQAGREEADYRNLQHAINLNIQQSASTSWAIGLNKNRQFDQLNQKALYSEGITLSYQWQSENGWAVSVNYGLSEDDDSRNESTNTATTADLVLSKTIDSNTWSLPLDGSVNLSVNYNDSELRDNLFDFFNQFGTTTVQLGVNFNLL